ncbi:helix-turn-helix domain-containing protein [Streptomyces sp. NPDC050448]|uniref:AraC-like ligand-binding domain-containing protein n=1 Tax=Streptomyces sp. NPDC050448 TaxID=3155404 RepID=UPI0034177405
MSSAAVPAAERFEWFSDMVAQELVPTSISSEHAADFQAEVSVLDLGPVQVSKFAYEPLRGRRTPAHIRSSDPEQYQLGLVTRGRMHLSQNGNESGFFNGDMVLWDTWHPFESCAPEDGGRVNAVILSFPRSAMPLRTDRVDRLLAQRIPGRHGFGAIVSQYLRGLAAHGADCGPAELERLGHTALDLVGTCLAGQLGAAEQLTAQARKSALLEQIDTFIGHNLGDPELTPAAVAARHSMSLRRLQLLFRERGETVAAGIRRRRLERCRAELSDPALLTRPVHVVAGRWGFSNAAVFSRVFREAYGASPSELRHQAVQEALARNINEMCAEGKRA